MADAKKIALAVMRATDPTGGLAEMLTEAVLSRAASKNSSGKEIPVLQEEAARQELEMKIAEAHARVAQEIAIARRIETAAEVDIEEYYDLSGEGHLGVKSGGQGLSLGAGAVGRRVRKRVYKFRGSDAPSQGVVKQGSPAAPQSAGTPGDTLRSAERKGSGG